MASESVYRLFSVARSVSRWALNLSLMKLYTDGSSLLGQILSPRPILSKKSFFDLDELVTVSFCRWYSEGRVYFRGWSKHSPPHLLGSRSRAAALRIPRRDALAMVAHWRLVGRAPIIEP